MAASSKGSEIPRPRDSEDQPTLLLRYNPHSDRWAYKRTHGPWIGGFHSNAAARADAERLGLVQPYRVEFVEAGE